MNRFKQWLRRFLSEWRTRPLKRFLHDLRIGLVDVGARGGLEPRWQFIQDNVAAFMFEPEEHASQALEDSEYIERNFNVGLGSSESESLFNLCRDPAVSSLLEPNDRLLSRFPNSRRFDVVAKKKINLSTLDKCLLGQRQRCDFIKLDTQGTELEILKGGAELLKSTVIGLEIEVEFLQIYRDQSLFGDICTYLAPIGYEFLDFINLYRWERKKFTDFGQTIFADALFLRSPETFSEMLNGVSREIAHDKSMKYVAIISLYDHIDLLPVCMDAFRPFIDSNEVETIGRLHRALSRRRRRSRASLNMMTRFMSRLFGIRIMPLQGS